MHSLWDITFIILTWNSEKYIEDCLKSIRSFKHLNVRIILVDNGSTDATVSYAESLQDNNLLLLKYEENRGTTVSRNRALRLTEKTDYICILDSDTIVNEDAFLRMIRELEADKSIGIIGPTMLNKEGIVQLSGRNLPSLSNKLLKAIPHKKLQERGSELEVPNTVIENGLQNVPYLLSACWLMKREAVSRIGYLDESIFYAPEDVDYCVRAWNAGYRVVRCWDVQIVHEYQRLSKKKLFSRMNLEHIKGLIHYFRKYGYLFDAGKIMSPWRMS